MVSMTFNIFLFLCVHTCVYVCVIMHPGAHMKVRGQPMVIHSVLSPPQPRVPLTAKPSSNDLSDHFNYHFNWMEKCPR